MEKHVLCFASQMHYIRCRIEHTDRSVAWLANGRGWREEGGGGGGRGREGQQNLDL